MIMRKLVIVILISIVLRLYNLGISHNPSNISITISFFINGV